MRSGFRSHAAPRCKFGSRQRQYCEGGRTSPGLNAAFIQFAEFRAPVSAYHLGFALSGGRPKLQGFIPERFDIPECLAPLQLQRRQESVCLRKLNQRRRRHTGASPHVVGRYERLFGSRQDNACRVVGKKIGTGEVRRSCHDTSFTYNTPDTRLKIRKARITLISRRLRPAATLGDLVASALVQGSESNLEAINVADRDGRRSRVSVPNVIETVFTGDRQQAGRCHRGHHLSSFHGNLLSFTKPRTVRVDQGSASPTARTKPDCGGGSGEFTSARASPIVLRKRPRSAVELRHLSSRFAAQGETAPRRRRRPLSIVQRNIPLPPPQATTTWLAVGSRISAHGSQGDRKSPASCHRANH